MEDDINYRWPKYGDRPFAGGSDWERDGGFTNIRTHRHLHMWDGNMKAGEVLADACMKEKFLGHELIYPILGNYRHALELAMKWFIWRYGSYSNQNTEGFEHHNLWKLWVLFRRIVEDFDSGDQDAMNAVEQVIRDFHDADKSGQTFRYPYSKQGNVAKFPENVRLDLMHLKDVMKGVSHFFDGVDGYLDHMVSSGYFDLP